MANTKTAVAEEPSGFRINGVDLVSFGCVDSPTPEMLAALKEVRGWPRDVVARMVFCQIDKYLAKHE